MKNTAFTFLLFSIIFLFQTNAFAQVRGISYSVAPTGEYVFWNKKAGLENGILLGGKVGFGFGQVLELRGVYQQGINQRTQFGTFSLPNYADSSFVSRDVKLTRWGGELKANLAKGKWLPYITAGTGIQSLQLDTFAVNKQIYVNLGAGLKFSLKGRYSIGIEARNTSYRFNTARNFLSPDDKTVFGVVDADYNPIDLNNWSIGASLQIHLGGQKQGEMSDLDKAYYNSLTGGFKNLGWTVEPSVGSMNFNPDLAYRNAFMAGGSAGIDFGPYFGIRGFYWQSMVEGEWTEFDQLAMYGGEMQMNLNTSTGVIPYITLGGGNIDVQSDYQGRTVILPDSTLSTLRTVDRGFAMGGIGLILPLSRNFKIFGGARAMLTTTESTNTFSEPDQVQTSVFYNVGVKLTFGKKSDNPDELLDFEVSQAVLKQKEKDQEEINALQAKYDEKILNLEDELNEAIIREDFAKAAAIKKELESAEQVAENLEVKEQKVVEEKAKVEEELKSALLGTPTPTQPIVTQPVVTQAPVATAPAYAQTPYQQQQQGQLNIIPSNSRISLSPAEFENLIEEILENMGGSNTAFYPYAQEQMYYGAYYTPNQGYNPNPGYNPNSYPYNNMGNANPSQSNPKANIMAQDINQKIADLEAQINKIGIRQDSMEKSISEQLKMDMDTFSKKLEESLAKFNENSANGNRSGNPTDNPVLENVTTDVIKQDIQQPVQDLKEATKKEKKLKKKRKSIFGKNKE